MAVGTQGGSLEAQVTGAQAVQAGDISRARKLCKRVASRGRAVRASGRLLAGAQAVQAGGISRARKLCKRVAAHGCANRANGRLLADVQAVQAIGYSQACETVQAGCNWRDFGLQLKDYTWSGFVNAHVG